MAEGARRQADPRRQGAGLGGADARKAIAGKTDPGEAQGMLKEFRDFAMRGNVVDLAVAVVIGAAFKQIIDAVVNDVIMPIIGIFGKADFTNFFLPLTSAVTATNLVDARKQGGVLAYGDFITVVINFLIVAAALFVIVKAINTMKKAPPAEPAAPPPPSPEVVLLTEIRDALKK
jgi:large conductance mechanosensitive channel